MSDQFNVGDVVYLASNPDPKMTIIGIRGDMAEAAWFFESSSSSGAQEGQR